MIRCSRIALLKLAAKSVEIDSSAKGGALPDAWESSRATGQNQHHLTSTYLWGTLNKDASFAYVRLHVHIATPTGPPIMAAQPTEVTEVTLPEN